MPLIMQCHSPPPASIHDVVPRYLSDKLLEQNRLNNVPVLTANQEKLIARLIWYQDGYEQPSQEDLERMTQMWQNMDDLGDNLDMPVSQKTEMTIITLQLIGKFAKSLPGITKISRSDQQTMLKACSNELMMLRLARRCDAVTDSILFTKNEVNSRDNYELLYLSKTYVTEDLLRFCQYVYHLAMDNIHFALLTAVITFSDRPGLEHPQLVQEIQRYYLNTLKTYILNKDSGSDDSALVYSKILSVLTELRTLGNHAIH